LFNSYKSNPINGNNKHGYSGLPDGPLETPLLNPIDIALVTFSVLKVELSVGRLGLTIAPKSAGSKADDALKVVNNFFLGKKPKVIMNKSGDKIMMTKDKKIRFDFKNSHGDKPHVHLEKMKNGKWEDAFDQHRFYPKE
jgi:hypothetical protein